MNRLPVFVALSMFSVTSNFACADTEFVGSVPLEVVKQFVGNPFRGESVLYSDIMDAFPPFTVPTDFNVLASADQGFVQRVILSSALDEEAVSAAVSEAFVAEGWTQIPMVGMASQQVGFVSADQPTVLPQQLCHDNYGTLTATVNNDEGMRYINISRSVGTPAMMRPGCAEMLAQVSQGYPMGFRGGNVLDGYAPKLIMPESNTRPTRPMAFMGGGGGGSMSDWETRGTLTIDWEVDAIYEHFAEQILEQGWEADSDATGAVAATGSWTKTVDDMDLVGTLSILKLADDTWDMRFRLVRQGNAVNGGPAINSVRIIEDVIR